MLAKLGRLTARTLPPLHSHQQQVHLIPRCAFARVRRTPLSRNAGRSQPQRADVEEAADEEDDAAPAPTPAPLPSSSSRISSSSSKPKAQPPPQPPPGETPAWNWVPPREPTQVNDDEVIPVIDGAYLTAQEITTALAAQGAENVVVVPLQPKIETIAEFVIASGYIPRRTHPSPHHLPHSCFVCPSFFVFVSRWSRQSLHAAFAQDVRLARARPAGPSMRPSALSRPSADVLILTGIRSLSRRGGCGRPWAAKGPRGRRTTTGCSSTATTSSSTSWSAPSPPLLHFHPRFPLLTPFPLLRLFLSYLAPLYSSRRRGRPWTWRRCGGPRSRTGPWWCFPTTKTRCVHSPLSLPLPLLLLPVQMPFSWARLSTFHARYTHATRSSAVAGYGL